LSADNRPQCLLQPPGHGSAPGWRSREPSAGPSQILAHISPAHSENINFFGVITVDVEAELAKLGPAGWRPLRPAAPDLSLLP